MVKTNAQSPVVTAELFAQHFSDPQASGEVREIIARNLSGLDGQAGTVSDQDMDRLTRGASKPNKALAVLVDETGQTREVPARVALPLARVTFKQARASLIEFQRLARTDPTAALERGLANKALLRASDATTLRALVEEASRSPRVSDFAEQIVRLINTREGDRQVSTAELVQILATLPPHAAGAASASLSPVGLQRIAALDENTRQELVYTLASLPPTHPQLPRILLLIGSHAAA